jgi:methylenetetrahydrofolate dehydrogenase (NADP+)/methenyltetrahydrofolate cyclohydrolase
MEKTISLTNIKSFTEWWKCRLRDRLDGQAASLVIVQVGDVEASNRYVRNKLKDCEAVGIEGILKKFPETVTQRELEKGIQEIVNEGPNGIIVQLPLPKHIDKDAITQLIPIDMDVDGFHKNSWFKPCTPLGIMKYLEHNNIELAGSHAVVVGRSEIVGKPMAQMLLDANATVTMCHSKTKNLYKHLTDANVIVSAVGCPGVINASVLPKDTVIVDVGINFVEGKLVGDVWNPSNADNVTPVPGGVGLLTRCALLENVVESMEKRGKVNEA